MLKGYWVDHKIKRKAEQLSHRRARRREGLETQVTAETHLLISLNHFLVPLSACSDSWQMGIGYLIDRPTKTSQNTEEGLFQKGNLGSTKRQLDNSWVAKMNRCPPAQTTEPLSLHSHACSNLLSTRFYYEISVVEKQREQSRKEGAQVLLPTV